MNAKDFYELVNQRQSTRAFDTERSVDREILNRILEAARMATSVLP